MWQSDEKIILFGLYSGGNITHQKKQHTDTYIPTSTNTCATIILQFDHLQTSISSFRLQLFSNSKGYLTMWKYFARVYNTIVHFAVTRMKKKSVEQIRKNEEWKWFEGIVTCTRLIKRDPNFKFSIYPLTSLHIIIMSFFLSSGFLLFFLILSNLIFILKLVGRRHDSLATDEMIQVYP